MTDDSSRQDPQPPGLDEGALQRLRSLDPDGRTGIVSRVLSTYEASLQRMLPQLEQARDAGDVATVGTLAHTLKSSSASVGAMALAALCADAERAARAGETAAVLAGVQAMLAAGQRALGAVRAILHP